MRLRCALTLVEVHRDSNIIGAGRERLPLPVTTDYTDIIARFTDQLAAETLANFITSAGIQCDIVDSWDAVGCETYGVRVLRNQIPDLRRVLELTPVAKRLTPTAAQVMAGQLARENVGCYVTPLSELCRHRMSVDWDFPSSACRTALPSVDTARFWRDRGLRSSAARSGTNPR